MDDMVFKEIANEIKGLNNQAVRLIGQGDFSNAEALCFRALDITQNITYFDGTAMVFYNLANLETLRGDILKAMAYGALCKEMHEKAQTDATPCEELLARLAKVAIKQGVEYEKQGRLREALECYYASAPFSGEKYRLAMLKEIAMIERLISDE